MPYKNEHIATANIIIAGITGSGKSTLVNSVFGLEGSDRAKTDKGLAVTDCIAEYSSPGVPIKILDTVGLEVNAKTTMRSIEDIKSRIRESGTSGSKDDFNINGIHAVWYCINAGSFRYQQDELKFVRDLHTLGVPFIIILTQCIQDDKVVKEFTDAIDLINRKNDMNDIQIVPVLAQDYEVRGMVIESFGLNDLVEATLRNLDGFVKNGFIAAQRVNVAYKKELALSILHKYVKEAVLSPISKVPLVNIFTTYWDMSNLFEEIAEVYNSVLSSEDIEHIWNEVWGFTNKLSAAVSIVFTFSDFAAYRVINDAIRTGAVHDFKDVGISTFTSSDQSAAAIALFGDTFISAITEMWQENIDGSTVKIERLVSELVRRIKSKWGKFKEYMLPTRKDHE